jgi:hypothetical protein
MHRLLATLLVTLLVAGCATTRSPQRAERPPEHAARVKMVIYDSSPRSKLDHIGVFDQTQPITKPHKNIALLTCEGAPHEEPEMTEAIIYRARMLGADAVIILPINSYQQGGAFFGGSGGGGDGRCVFRGEAVVYKTSE